MGLSLDRRTFSIAAGAAAVTAATASKAAAQEASPAAEGGPPGLPPLPEGVTVVAEGLFSARFIAFGDDGTMYVTDTGFGGDEVLELGPPPGEEGSPAAEQATPVTEEGTPAAEEPPVTRGFTGQVVQVATDGTQSVAVDGLASYSIGVGPHGIAVRDGLVYFAIGGAAPSVGIEPIAGENGVHVFDPATSEVTQLAEFNTYEIENNPDGQDINPNLYGISFGDSDGRLTVNDAGGNTTYSVDVETGEFQLRAVYPTLDVLVPDAGFEPRHVVPTGSAYMGTTLHTSFLSEFWPPDAPSIVTVAGDGDFATFAPVVTGLSFVTSLAVGPDGLLYFCQLFDDPEGPPVGSVHRVVDGTPEVVVEGLVMPHGIAFDGDGNLFITINTLLSGPGMPAAQVVRMDGVAPAM